VKTVYLSLGSNLGDREANLRAGIAALAGAGAQVKRVSSIYETEPIDYLDQGWFLNCVLKAETELEPLELLRKLREIESRMGSKKIIAKGPRILDMDILLYGQEAIATEELQVPHPRMLQRKFVLVPLAEIAPEVKHRAWPGTAAEMLARCPDASVVRRLEGSAHSD
jgi:2-amino-4-hydroxy-6-hydroxymethyldihydropteridine diphosphokinase